LTFHFQENREFSPEELETSRALAHQAGLAIRLTRLAKGAKQAATASLDGAKEASSASVHGTKRAASATVDETKKVASATANGTKKAVSATAEETKKVASGASDAAKNSTARIGGGVRRAASASADEIASAKASGKVWVNTDSGVYHKNGQYYGTTKQGKFMNEQDAVKAGYRQAK